ncbi:MAG: amino acid-binding protein [Lachnospiraceae bacterium]|nr:amino acid-binding protein [Lachnospiraceae bacterium]
MLVKQLSVFVENREGKMREIAGLLKENAIDIKTISLADTSDYGMLRMVVSDADKAYSVLRDAGYPAKVSELLAVKASNYAGCLYDILEAISNGVDNIEYLYTLPTEAEPYIVIKVADPEAAEKLLQEKGY